MFLVYPGLLYVVVDSSHAPTVLYVSDVPTPYIRLVSVFVVFMEVQAHRRQNGYNKVKVVGSSLSCTYAVSLAEKHVWHLACHSAFGWVFPLSSSASILDGKMKYSSSSS